MIYVQKDNIYHSIIGEQYSNADCGSRCIDIYGKCLRECESHPMIVIDPNGIPVSTCPAYCYQQYITCIISCPEPSLKDEYYADWPFYMPQIINDTIVVDLSTQKKEIVNENNERKEVRVFRNGTKPPPMVNFTVVFGDGPTITDLVESGYKEKGNNFLVNNVLHECNCKNGVDDDKDGLKDCPNTNNADWSTIDNDCYSVCNTNWEIGAVREEYYAYPVAGYPITRNISNVKYLQISVQYFTEIFYIDEVIHPLTITDFSYIEDGSNKGRYIISFKTSNPCISYISCENAKITKIEPDVENVFHTFTADLTENETYILKIDLKIPVFNGLSLQKGIVKVITIPTRTTPLSPTQQNNQDKGNQGVWILLILIIAAIYIIYIIYRWWKQKSQKSNKSKSKNKNRKISKNKNR